MLSYWQSKSWEGSRASKEQMHQGPFPSASLSDIILANHMNQTFLDYHYLFIARIKLIYRALLCVLYNSFYWFRHIFIAWTIYFIFLQVHCVQFGLEKLVFFNRTSIQRYYRTFNGTFLQWRSLVKKAAIDLCLCVKPMHVNTCALAQNKKSIWSSVWAKLTLDIFTDTPLKFLHKNLRELSGNAGHFFPFIHLHAAQLFAVQLV